MPASRHLFRPSAGLPAPTPEARDLVAYLQALGRGRRDVWAEWRRREVTVPPAPAADDALARRGRELYGRHCAACHGEAGDGRGGAAVFFTMAPRDFTAGLFRFRSTPPGRPPADDDLFRAITLGSGTGAAMPSFYWLEERDRWALVLAVKRLAPGPPAAGRAPNEGADSAGPPAGAGPAGREGEDHGRRLWTDLGCATCHGAQGEGVPGAGPDLTHACGLRAGASPEALDRSVRWGVGTAMPSYGEALPEASSRRLLIDYVGSLSGSAAISRDTPDRP